MANWTLVKDFVKSEFEDYLPVPTIACWKIYQPLNFLILQNRASFAPKWYEKPLRKTLPKFESVGDIDNFAVSRPLEDNSFIPEIRKEKLCISGDARNKTTLEGQIAKTPVDAEGSMKTSTVSPYLGIISRYSVSYRELRKWIKQYCFLVSAEDMRLEAKQGNLFVIHDVIMAEKLSCKGKTKQSSSAHITSFFKLNYKSEASLALERPSDFGSFPIAYKIGKIKAPRLKHASHAMIYNTACPESSSSNTPTNIYRLKLEPLRDFCKSSSKRKFEKENSPLSDDSLSPSRSRPPKQARGHCRGSNELKARKCLAKMLV